MEIRNPTQFANFIRQGGFQNLDMAFIQIVTCIDNASKMCNCHGGVDKRKMYDTCNIIYMNAVRQVVPRFQNEFLSKTTERQINFFLENGSLIGLVCR